VFGGDKNPILNILVINLSSLLPTYFISLHPSIALVSPSIYPLSIYPNHPYPSPAIQPHLAPPHRLRIQEPWPHTLNKLFWRRHFMRLYIAKTHEKNVACRQASACKNGVGDSVRHGFGGDRYRQFGLGRSKITSWEDISVQMKVVGGPRGYCGDGNCEQSKRGGCRRSGRRCVFDRLVIIGDSECISIDCVSTW
jgi:hypothetical protein